MDGVMSAVLPPEAWQRWLAGIAAWAHRHPVLVRRLLRARATLSWIVLGWAVVMLLLWPPGRHVAAVVASGYLMLAVLALLSRTRTVAWTTIMLWFQGMLAWSVAIGLIATVVAGPLVTALRDGPVAVDVGVIGAGAITAVAAIGEESLKLLPLALLAFAAPGRVRRFSRLDWLVLGYASGLAFMTVEEGVRTWLRVVRPSGLAELLGDPLPGLMWWPFSGRSATSLGYAGPEQVPVAEYAGHNVLTAITSASVGLAVWQWRRRGLPGRVLGVVMPVLVWGASVVDHFAVNALSVSPRWLVDPVHGPTAAFRWASDVTGHGIGRAALLIGVFALCLVLDARVMVHGADGPTMGPVSALRDGVRCAVSRARLELGTVLMARAVVDGETRRASVDRARHALHAVRTARVSAFAAVTEERQALSEGLRPVVRSRRRVRVAAAGASLLLALCVPASAVLAARIGPFMSIGTTGWLSGLLHELADWWHALPWWQQVLITAAIVLLVALLMLASGGTFLAAVGLGSGVSGVATYVADHGHGMGGLVIDPGAASRQYLRTATPGQVVTDAIDFGLTFIPGSALGAAATKVMGRPLLRSRGLFHNLEPTDPVRISGFEAIDPARLVGQRVSAKFNYVVLGDGELVVAARRFGHIDLANGAPVRAAGELRVVHGVLHSFDNRSGHYRPSGAGMLEAAMKAFREAGWSVDDRMFREVHR